jgi:glutamate dehydrogenase (NADP+)
MHLKNVERKRLSAYLEKYPKASFFPGKRVWEVPCDIALPCATQNELEIGDARTLVANNCKAIGEGANMPCTPEAISHFQSNGVFYAPGKASNAGGVAVSGLEMAQNSLRYNWTREQVDDKLKDIMSDIHSSCLHFGEEKGNINYVKGANIAGFVKVADAMLAQGVV